MANSTADLRVRSIGATVLAVVLLVAVVGVAASWRADRFGFEGPVDAKRLAVSDEAVRSIQPDLRRLPTPAGLTDQGVDIQTGCRMGDSVSVGPYASRIWTAPKGTDLRAAALATASALTANGWQATDAAGSFRRAGSAGPLLAELEQLDHSINGTDAEIDLRLFVAPDGPDGCTA